MDAIKIKDLYYSYPRTSKNTLKKLTFSLSRGEIFGFLGPSGAGKTTTQKILIGILKNYRGEVKVLGRDISEINSDFYENIGVAFENPSFYERFTALENLSYFASLYQKETNPILPLLSGLNLEEFANMRVKEYSKGMKVRLNLCRALLPQPEILFLDEPTAGLDPVNASRVKEIIRSFQEKDKTVFLTTHDMGVAEDICDRVAFIIDGQICLIDSPRKLKLKNGQKKVLVEFVSHGKGQTREFLLQGLADNREFLDLLKNYEIETIHTQEASLASIFINVTGRKLV